jgi:hypothetical protein
MSAARYKVEHCDTRGVWVPMHRGLLRSHKSALAKKQAFCRILVDYLGNGVWEEIETLPYGSAVSAKWDAEKRTNAAGSTS